MHSHVSGLFNYLGHKMYELLRENSSIFFYQPPFLVYFQEVDMKLLRFKLSGVNAVKTHWFTHYFHSWHCTYVVNYAVGLTWVVLITVDYLPIAILAYQCIWLVWGFTMMLDRRLIAPMSANLKLTTSW